MKKTKIILICVLLSVCFDFSVQAEFLNAPLMDGAEYLTDSQKEEISAVLSAIREEYGFDVAIYTENDPQGHDPQYRAESIYDENGYGAGDERDGILLYVNGERDYYYVRGENTVRISQYGFDILDDKVLPYLSKDDYYNAFLSFAYTAQDLLLSYEEYPEKEYDDVYGEYDRYYDDYNDIYYDGEYIVYDDGTGILGTVLIFVVALPLIIAFILTYTKQRKMNTVRSENGAYSYIKSGSFSLDRSQDIFLYSNITKTPKPKPNHNSGSSRSSFGGGHGGGRSHGGKF